MRKVFSLLAAVVILGCATARKIELPPRPDLSGVVSMEDISGAAYTCFPKDQSQGLARYLEEVESLLERQ